ncbi:hypothetical protein EI94DRAFT_1812609 [Lactarius quietus]|nr:hypothetical protein EI94DRAFT_1812609 [Lactarius quietus]
MASPTCDQDHLADKLHAAGKPCFSAFEERRLAGVPPPDMGSSSDSLAIPGDLEDLTTTKLLPEDGASAAWLVANIRRGEDVVMARIPAWAGDCATSCMPGHNALYSAVFETFARINHSCCPNAMFRWDKDTFSGEIRAMRPISEGEEVTIAYFQDILEPATITHYRQKYLLEAYKFKCTCPVCARSSKARARSDDDRPVLTVSVMDIGAYYRETVYDWITRGGNDHARLLNYLHTIEAALDREMIFYPVHWIYLARVIVMVRCALREGKAARKWAQRAAQHSRALTGSDGGWDAIARDRRNADGGERGTNLGCGEFGFDSKTSIAWEGLIHDTLFAWGIIRRFIGVKCLNAYLLLKKTLGIGEGGRVSGRIPVLE